MAVFVTRSAEETFALAERYAASLHDGDVVLLDGEMGAGKTAFAKGVAKGMGIGCEVTSPTYAYINSYENRLFHFDCYRVPSEEYAESLGFSEYFGKGVCLVEWGEKIAGLLPENVKHVRIRKGANGEREITL